MAFEDNLKKLRQEKGLRQKDLAKIIGVSSGAIGMYENNKRAPDFETLKKIATYFQVSTDYLAVAKEMQDKGIPIEDIKKILDVLKKHT